MIFINKHQEAREYYNLKPDCGYHLHHVNPRWKFTDKERYDQWNPEDLVPLTVSEHLQLHYLFSDAELERLYNDGMITDWAEAIPKLITSRKWKANKKALQDKYNIVFK